MVNPYGEGHASEKIVEVLTTVPLAQDLLIKRHTSPMGRLAPASGVPLSR
jgi:hypothetical protein